MRPQARSLHAYTVACTCPALMPSIAWTDRTNVIALDYVLGVCPYTLSENVHHWQGFVVYGSCTLWKLECPRSLSGGLRI